MTIIRLLLNGTDCDMFPYVCIGMAILTCRLIYQQNSQRNNIKHLTSVKGVWNEYWTFQRVVI